MSSAESHGDGDANALVTTIDTLDALSSNIPHKDAHSKRLLWLLQLVVRPPSRTESVSETRYCPHNRELTELDYKHSIAHTFSVSDSEKVVIEEVAPLVFASTRYACGIEQDKFAVEWSLTKQELEALDEKEKEQTFLFSRSNLLLLMTISQKQYDQILTDLESYHDSCQANHNMVLLHRFGLFKVGKFHYAIFNNFLGSATPKAEYSARIAKQLETSPSSNLKEVKRIFGVPLAILVGQNQLPEFLPTIIRRLGQFQANDRNFQFYTYFVQDWDTAVPVEKTQAALENGEQTIDGLNDPKVVVALLLSFLRDLPDDIIYKDAFYALRQCLSIKEKKEQERAVQCIIVQIPPVYRSLLRYIVDTITNLAASSQEYMKALDAICQCFAPLVIAPLREPSPDDEQQDAPPPIGGMGGLSGVGAASMSQFKLQTTQKSGLLDTIKNSINDKKTKDKESKDKEGSREKSPDSPTGVTSSPTGLRRSGVIPPVVLAEGEAPRRRSSATQKTVFGADASDRSDVLKMIIMCGPAVFQLEVTRLKFVEEYGRVLLSKATFPELILKLLDENYEEKEFPAIFFSCLRYFSDYDAVFTEVRKYLPPSSVPEMRAVRSSRRLSDDRETKPEKEKKSKSKDREDKSKEKEKEKEKVVDLSPPSENEDHIPRMFLHRRSRMWELLNDVVARYLNIVPEQEKFRESVKKFLHDYPPSIKHSMKMKALLSFASYGTVNVSRMTVLQTAADESASLGPVAVPALGDRPSKTVRGTIEADLFKEHFPVRTIAEQLTIVEFRLIERLPPRELFNKNWEKKEKSPFFHSLLEFTNNLAIWTQNYIVSCMDVNERAVRFGSIIELATQCVNLGNFECGMTFFSALHASAVDRLKNSKALLAKAAVKQLDDLTKLFSMERNYQRYRKRLQQTSPAIPYLASFTKELFMVEEGNPSVIKEALKNDSLELVNLTKFRMIFSTVVRFQKFQQMRFPYKVESPLFDYFATLSPEMTLNDLRDLSLKAEPKDQTPAV